MSPCLRVDTAFCIRQPRTIGVLIGLLIVALPTIAGDSPPAPPLQPALEGAEAAAVPASVSTKASNRTELWHCTLRMRPSGVVQLSAPVVCEDQGAFGDVAPQVFADAFFERPCEHFRKGDKR